MADSSIMINGVHRNWEKVDPAEYDKWKILEDQRDRLHAEERRILSEQYRCVGRTRAKYPRIGVGP